MAGRPLNFIIRFISIISLIVFSLQCRISVPFHERNYSIENQPDEIFLRRILDKLHGNICLITNQTGLGRYILYPVMSKGPTRLHELLESDGRKLHQVYTPEHGITAQEEGNGNGSVKYHPVAIYEHNDRKLKNEWNHCDVIVFDLPDSGIRPFTYRTILVRSMRAAQLLQNDGKKIRFIMIDAPDPAGYLRSMGPLVQKKHFSILGEETIPFFPGYTTGELAKRYYYQMNMTFESRVLGLKKYTLHEPYMEQTFHFRPPSPNLPDFRSLECYWMAILIEGTLLEEGRGTKDPFCVIGHPNFNYNKIPPENKGVFWEPFSFIPFSGRYKDKFVNGFRLNIKDPWDYNPLETSYELFTYLLSHYPELELFRRYPDGAYVLDHLMGNSSMREALQKKLSYQSWKDTWEAEVKNFRSEMSSFAIY